jgi:hypothetical protein
VMPEDIRWMLALTAPRIKRTMASYDPALELDEATYARTNKVLEKTFSNGEHLTRTELGLALNAAGIGGDTRRVAHIVMRAELEAIVCSGALRGKQHTYALLTERAPNARTLDRDEALAELTRRYFTSHGPALARDFAWWSGLTVADARSGIQMAKSDLASETVDGKTYWLAPRQMPHRETATTAHLLPNYDEYLIAYRDRSAFFHPLNLGRDAKFLSGVLSRHIIVVDGQVIGGWRLTANRDGVAVEGTLLVQPNKAQQSALSAAAKDYGRFLGRTVSSELTAIS